LVTVAWDAKLMGVQPPAPVMLMVTALLEGLIVRFECTATDKQLKLYVPGAVKVSVVPFPDTETLRYVLFGTRVWLPETLRSVTDELTGMFTVGGVKGSDVRTDPYVGFPLTEKL